MHQRELIICRNHSTAAAMLTWGLPALGRVLLSPQPQRLRLPFSLCCFFFYLALSPLLSLLPCFSVERENDPSLSRKESRPQIKSSVLWKHLSSIFALHQISLSQQPERGVHGSLLSSLLLVVLCVWHCLTCKYITRVPMLPWEMF